jgi:hypothetical protein
VVDIADAGFLQCWAADGTVLGIARGGPRAYVGGGRGELREQSHGNRSGAERGGAHGTEA